MGRHDDRIAVVTGAARGIGRGIAHKLTAEGATVVVTDIDEEAAAATAAELGGGATSHRTDVADRASVDATVAAVLADHGRIDVLVNNAGWDVVGPFVDSDPELWDRIVRINLFGVLHTCHAVLPHLQERGTGAIVNIASDAGRVGSSGEAVYSAAKGGVIAFTKTLAREAARQRIRVNCVCPGPSDTALFAEVAEEGSKLREALIRAIPFRRLADPTDLANAVAFLASDEAAYITGQTLSVSGGLTMA